jgi:hypothetical protein
MTRAGKGSVPGRPKRTSWEQCKAEGCIRTTEGGSRGFCHTHYVASRRGALDQKTGQRVRPVLRVSSYGAGARCSVEGCCRRPRGNGLCFGHWQRQKNGQTLEGPIRPRALGPFVKCLMESCEKRAVSRGMCEGHAEKRRRGLIGSDGLKLRDPLPRGRQRTRARWVDQVGYTIVWAPQEHPMARQDGSIAEHRLVMEQVLGRYLESWEIVHHKNGDRSDNRPENLEVMDGRARRGPGHPPGHEHSRAEAARVLLQDKTLPDAVRSELEKLI